VTQNVKGKWQDLKQDAADLRKDHDSFVPNSEAANIDKERSPEAHPFPEDRGNTIYKQAQWQDGGKVHDVKPSGQGVHETTKEKSIGDGEKDLTSA
jgi:hypothetical protein